MQTTRIVLVDDHPVLRRGLRDLLESTAGWCVCGEAGTSSEALRLVETSGPDVALVDVALEGANGLDLIKRLVARDEAPRVLAYSMHDEEIFAERALRAGARGYLMKQTPPETLLTALDVVRRGQVYLSPEMSARILERTVSGGVPTGESPLSVLSDRELEVFGAVGRGEATAEIADRLGLSVKTIETYREKVKRKLGLRNGQELLRRAIEWTLAEGEVIRESGTGAGTSDG
jgi:DNA-binding NarL/FixJ family response regulator